MATLLKLPFVIKHQNQIHPHFDMILASLAQNKKLHFTKQAQTDLRTAFYEAVVNAMVHAHELKNHSKITGHWFLDNKRIGFEVFDHGPGFDLKHVPVPDFNSYQSSGRGVFMMKLLGDELIYKQMRKKNSLKFSRYLMSQSANAQEIDFLYQMSEVVLQGQTLDQIYQMILDQALSLFHVERASILIYDKSQKALIVAASRGIDEAVKNKIRVKPGQGVSGYVYQHARALFIEDIDKNERGLKKQKHYKSKSFISVPLIYSPLKESEQTLGVINLTDRKDGKVFTKKDLTLLSTIANQAMASLHILNLIDEVKKNASVKNQLEVVCGIQQSYLPDKPLHEGGFFVEGLCEMADSMGGDYYDYHRVNDWLYLVVADVSGHNMSSAMAMFNFRSQLKALMGINLEPKELLKELNKSLMDDLNKSGHFVTALILQIHTKTLAFKIASAGHYPPLFYPERFLFVPQGLVLGVDETEDYAQAEGFLEPNDQLLLYTDGVLEAMNAKNQFYGLDRLKAYFKNNLKTPTPDFVRNLVNEVKKFRDVASPLDDLTVLTLKC